MFCSMNECSFCEVGWVLFRQSQHADDMSICNAVILLATDSVTYTVLLKKATLMTLRLTDQSEEWPKSNTQTNNMFSNFQC